MTRVIAVLATLDTKGHEAGVIKEQLEKLGSQAYLVDLSIQGDVTLAPSLSRDEVAAAAGTNVTAIAALKDQEAAGRTMAAGAAGLLASMVQEGKIHGILGLGGLRGTSTCTQVMRAMPYGLPKVMVSTVASGDTAPYVDIKDITMAFSVSDILGINRFTKKILANAAGAVHGMAQVDFDLDRSSSDKPLIGMSNLGVLTQGAMKALEYFQERGYEVVVFHAVGSGGRAMEELMKQGVIGAVFDYAMGEIADEVFEGLRAGGAERLTVAGSLGIPQVLCPGGCEHLGVLVNPPNTVPDRYKSHQYVFHNPVVFVPRLKPEEFEKVAEDIGKRLQSTKGNAVMMLPLGGTGRYAMEGGELRDEEGDARFFAALKRALPSTVEVQERATHAEDPAFVKECVDRLIDMVEGKS